MRDAQCVGCEVGIGWVYDKEWEESQRYKEGMNIFEMELVISKESWDCANVKYFLYPDICAVFAPLNPWIYHVIYPFHFCAGYSGEFRPRPGAAHAI